MIGPGGANITGNESSTVQVNSTLEDYNEKMTKFSLYQVYIGAAVFVAAYFQVILNFSHLHFCKDVAYLDNF